jgi:hypothetical protein
LTVGGRTVTQPLTVKMDPRVTTPAGGLAQQFDAQTKIADALRQDYDALQQVRSVRAQLKSLLMPARALPTPAAEGINALEKTLGALEGSAGGFGVRTRNDSFAALNTNLATVYEMADSADAAPTSQAVATFADLQQALALLLTKWNEVKTRDVPALNEKLRAANLRPIEVTGP